ncbi:MAG: alpha-glucosidase C-terminal domain-containing protein, partial [Thermomonas sp.]|nr:alpha-glucosidase C-terminal domain-containing protein [Thermomonas sp.]
IRFLDAPASILAFVREHAGERVLVAFNLSGSSIEWTPRRDIALLDVPGIDAAVLHDGCLQFPPRGAAFARLA